MGTEAGRKDGDMIAILLEQHRRIRELFTQIKTAQGEQKKQRFDELRALLAVHETAEQMILRPVAKKTAGEEEANARNREEKEATEVLSELEKLDLESTEFASRFTAFERSVIDHAEHEEREEFPAVRQGCEPDELQRMGRRLLAVEKMAPTHPHPAAAGSTAAQWMAGPFASLVDRVKDSIGVGTKSS